MTFKHCIERPDFIKAINLSKRNQSGSTATDVLLVTFGILSIGALAFTIAGLPALILLRTLAEILK